LFIHGIYHDLDDALKRFGQFLALGHFPPHLKPFCFSWPGSSSPLLYWCASSSASDNDVHRDLRRFVRMLARAGITNLHVMCHSMGSRLFLRSFALLKEAFKRRAHFRSPNASFGDYRASAMELLDASARSPPPSLTSSTVLGGSNGVTSPTGAAASELQITLQNVILLNPDYEAHTFLNDYWDMQQYCANITLYADSRDAPAKAASTMSQFKNLGEELFTDQQADKYLAQLNHDIDMIDTMDLDRNVDSQFHGYFNINRLMVDDLYELIVTGKRAEQRSSRLKHHKGTYRFTIVPASVVNI